MAEQSWHGPLTKLVRLAQNEPEAEAWISEMLVENMPAILDDAIAVALETGDPLPALLAQAIAAHPSLQAAEALARRVPVGASLLQESAIAAVDQLLADPTWPADADAGERSSRRFALEAGLASRLAGADRLEDGRALAERLIEEARGLPEEDSIRARLVDAHDIVAEAALAAGEADAAVRNASRALEIRIELGDPQRLPAEGGIRLAGALRAAGAAAEELEILGVAADELILRLEGRRDSLTSIEDSLTEGAEAVEISVRMGWQTNGFDELVLDDALKVDFLRRLLAISLNQMATAVRQDPDLDDDVLAAALRRLRAGQQEVRRGGPILDFDVEVLELLAGHAGRIEETAPEALASDLEQAAEDAAGLGDSELAARARAAQVECLRKAGDADRQPLVNALGRLGQVLEGAGRPDEAVAVARESAELARGSGDEPFALHGLARRLSAAGLTQEAFEASTRAVGLISERMASDPELHPDALAMLLTSLSKRAEECGVEIEPTEDMVAATVAMLDRVGLDPGSDLERPVYAAFPVVNAAVNRGEGEAARRVFDAIVRLAGRRPDDASAQYARSLLGSNLVWDAIEAGDLGAARVHLGEVAAAAEERPDDRLVAEYGKAAADMIATYQRTGDMDAAARLASEARTALLSPAYLEMRRAQIDEDQSAYVVAVEDLAGS